MYRIVTKQRLNEAVTSMEILAPYVAAKARPGQFIILRVDEQGERIPLTVAGCDAAAGTVRIIFQVVGATTALLNARGAGDCIQDLVGPLGAPTHLEGLADACIVGGGVGCAIALPLAQALCAAGAKVTSIIGFRSRGLVILEEEFAAASTQLYRVSDDGGWGEQGTVCRPLQRLLESGRRFDNIFAIGPLVMMRAVAATARPSGIPCTVSMNPIMIDGTGMCGGCRLRVGGRTRFACVDGPDFDGYQVDFDEAICRAGMYRPQEARAREAACRLLQKEVL